MQLRVLGCSGGIGQGLDSTALLIDDDILIDAGTGINNMTLHEMQKIRHVFITHAHLDHVACLPLMVDSIFDLIKTPIIIHAQQVTIDALRKHIFNWAIWPDFSSLPSDQHPVMKFEAMSPGETIDIGNRSIEMIPVNHIVPAVAFRVEEDSRSFAYSGDTTENDAFWAALNRHKSLDMLLVETAFSNAEEELSWQAKHYCPKVLATDLIKLKHRPEVYITHNKPGEENIIISECRSLLKEFNIKPLVANEVHQI